MSTRSAAIDPQTELVAASRERAVSSLSPRERLTLVFVVTVALASRIELEVGSGFASPEELVLIPMLFALPAGWVPAVVALGLVLGQLPSYLLGRVPTQRIIVSIGNASSTLAPALVFLLFYDPSAGPVEWAALTAF